MSGANQPAKKKVDQVLSLMLIRAYMIDTYLNLVQIPEVNLIDWDVELQGKPELAALNLREFWNIPNGRIVNLSKILEDNGIFVIEIDFGNDKIDGYSMWSPVYGVPLVFVNTNYSEDRKRATISHELGHLVLHKNRFTISQYRDVEKEAYAFASEFMVPLKEFKSQIGYDRITFNKLGSLKQYWKMSMHFFVYKSESYNIITKNQARYLYQQLAPYRKKEPIEFSILEKPSLLGEVMGLVEKEFNYSINDSAKMVGLKTEEFSNIRRVAMKHYNKLRIA